MRALVLCAGRGTRLGELTRELPKPLLPIGGVPLVVRMLRHLAAMGFTEVAINLHHRAEALREGVGDGASAGVAVTYSFEPTLLGTAGAVRNLGGFLGGGDDDSFLVLYGDLLLDEDLRPMIAAHRARDATATLLVHRRAGSNSLVALDGDGRVASFLERPDEATRRANPLPWVNSGAQILHRRALSLIPADGPADLPADVYAPLVDRERFYGHPLSGYRCAIDSPARYAAACAAHDDGSCRLLGQRPDVRTGR